MSWTTPRTWVAGEVVTAAIMNAHVRDNLNAIMQRGTSLPGAPGDQELYAYTVDATMGIEWVFKYNAGSASTYKWEFVGGPPAVIMVGSAESVISAAYVDAGTVGPTLALPRAGDYHFSYSCQVSAAPGTHTDIGYMAYALSGGTTYAATDTDAAIAYGSIANIGGGSSSAMLARLHTGIASGTTITSKYHNTDATITTCFFSNRHLSILPVRVI